MTAPPPLPPSQPPPTPPPPSTGGSWWSRLKGWQKGLLIGGVVLIVLIVVADDEQDLVADNSPSTSATESTSPEETTTVPEEGTTTTEQATTTTALTTTTLPQGGFEDGVWLVGADIDADVYETLLESLAVEAEQPNGYDRGLFRHWVDADGDGCDTRREVLITEAVTAPAVLGGRCVLSDGVWVSRYDGETDTGNGRGFDIDHLVPLKEAWDSGAHGWDPQTREQFANDLGFEHSLVAVSAGSNRSKGAQDPTTWLPPESSQRCWYAAAWISVKVRWDLSVDSAEADALRNIISGCSDNEANTALPAPVVTVAQSTSTTTTTTPPTTTVVTVAPGEGCHPAYSLCIPHREGDALNCGDLTAAQKPVTVKVVGVDPYRLDGDGDGDGDGRGCTS